MRRRIKVISENNAEDFEGAINQAFEEGWLICQSPSIAASRFSVVYVQLMFKAEYKADL